MTEWLVQNLDIKGGVARFDLSAVGYLSGIPHMEYMVRVNPDGTFVVHKEKGGWWRECNGVVEEAEPLLYATLRKAQALAILKG